MIPATFLALCAWVVPALSAEGRVRWDQVYNTSAFNLLDDCAQPCVADINNSLDCWKYTCVCSNNKAGPTFLNGTNIIQECVRQRCPPQSVRQTIRDALVVFQSICAVPYFNFGLPVEDTTGTVTGTSALARVTATISAPPIPLATFDASSPVFIDSPDGIYKKQHPCIRWVLNLCKSPKDNQTPGVVDCKVRDGLESVDLSKSWNGLGAYLQCNDAECVCNNGKFFISLQKFYDHADYFCRVGFPYEGGDRNVMFEDALTMMAEYCSEEAGMMLAKWILALRGYVKDEEWSMETKVNVGVTGASGFLTLVNVGVAIWMLRKKVPEPGAIELKATGGK